jgi:hypothetical protein
MPELDYPVGLRCDSCLRIIECSSDQMLQYARTNWPRCCAEVMSLFTSNMKPEKMRED